MILPAMGIIRVTPVIAANRYAYLPSIGFLIVLAAFFARLWRVPHGHGPAALNLAIMLILLILSGAETLTTQRYLRHWRDTPSLYAHMLTINPHSAALNTDMGAYRARRGETTKALNHYHRALELTPDFPMAHFNLAVLLGKSTYKIDEAIEHYIKALDSDPEHTEARLNLGSMLLLKGDLVAAVEQFRKTVRVTPKFAQGHYNLGKTLIITDHPKEGLEHLREAIQLNPGFVLGLKDLAWFLATHPDPEVRDTEEALRVAERASELTRNRDPEVLNTLAAAYAARRQFSLAVSMAERALSFASRKRNGEMENQIRMRLELYKQNKPYTQYPTEQKAQLTQDISQDESGTKDDDTQEGQ